MKQLGVGEDEPSTNDYIEEGIGHCAEAKMSNICRGYV
jgi:hypothetical protein